MKTTIWVLALLTASLEAIAQGSGEGPLKVISSIVKRVPVTGPLGAGTRFRYFFTVQNSSAAPFRGKIEIKLLNKMAGITNGREVFTCDLPPGRSQVGYIDAHTGPERFHADASVARFSFSVDDGSAVVGKGEGAITAAFEEIPTSAKGPG